MSTRPLVTRIAPIQSTLGSASEEIMSVSNDIVAPSIHNADKLADKKNGARQCSLNEAY